MFGHRYFGARYYAPRYFGDGGSGALPVVTRRPHGGRRPRAIEDEYFARARAELEEYYAELEARTEVSPVVRDQPQPTGVPAPAPRVTLHAQLTQLMAKTATGEELATIAAARVASAEDRELARAEKERRRRAAATVVLLMTH